MRFRFFIVKLFILFFGSRKGRSGFDQHPAGHLFIQRPPLAVALGAGRLAVLKHGGIFTGGNFHLRAQAGRQVQCELESVIFLPVNQHRAERGGDFSFRGFQSAGIGPDQRAAPAGDERADAQDKSRQQVGRRRAPSVVPILIGL